MARPSQVAEVSEADTENGTNVKSFITQGQCGDKAHGNVKGGRREQRGDRRKDGTEEERRGKERKLDGGTVGKGGTAHGRERIKMCKK